MIRSTVGNATNGQRLESLLQNRLGLKYMQSKKLVASGREALSMNTDEAWTPELEAECLQQYEKEHGPIQARDYSSPAAAAVVSPPKKDFAKSTPSPAKPATAAPVVKKEEPVKVEEPVVEPELTPEDDPAEAPKEEESAAKKEEEPAATKKEEPAPVAAKPSDENSDDDGDDSDSD